MLISFKWSFFLFKIFILSFVSLVRAVLYGISAKYSSKKSSNSLLPKLKYKLVTFTASTINCKNI